MAQKQKQAPLTGGQLLQLLLRERDTRNLLHLSSPCVSPKLGGALNAPERRKAPHRCGDAALFDRATRLSKRQPSRVFELDGTYARDRESRQAASVEHGSVA
jgi:hypothetical protein